MTTTAQQMASTADSCLTDGHAWLAVRSPNRMKTLCSTNRERMAIFPTKHVVHLAAEVSGAVVSVLARPAMENNVCFEIANASCVWAAACWGAQCQSRDHQLTACAPGKGLACS